MKIRDKLSLKIRGKRVPKTAVPICGGFMLYYPCFFGYPPSDKRTAEGSGYSDIDFLVKFSPEAGFRDYDARLKPDFPSCSGGASMSFRPACFVHRRDLPRGSAGKSFPYEKRKGWRGVSGTPRQFLL